MHSAIRITFLISIFIYQGHLNGSLIESGVLEKNLSNNTSCLIYQPYLGIVEDIESLDVKSDKFEMFFFTVKSKSTTPFSDDDIAILFI